MSISNSKFRNNREAPTEPFKRAVTSCLKAIAKALTRSEESIKIRAKADGLEIAKLR